MYGVKTECDTLICRGCLSTDRKLSPLTRNYDLYCTLLNKNSTEDLKYYTILICWECEALLGTTEVFRKKLQKAQHVLSLGYDRHISFATLSTLTFSHKQDYDYSIEEPIEPKPEINFIDNCEDIDIKEEFNSDHFENDDLNYSENEVKEDNQSITVAKTLETNMKEDVKVEKEKRNRRRISKEKSSLKKIDNSIDFSKLGLYFSKVSLSETEVQESLAKESDDNDSVSRPYKCSICGFRFASKTQLFCHKRDNHKKRRNVVKCPLCVSTHSSRAGLLLHWRQCHPVNRCAFCARVVERDEDRDKHLREHMFRYCCLKCDVEFNDKLLFRYHDKQLHTKYECAHCGRKCTAKRSLEKHIRNLHLPNPCVQCGLVFNTRARLLRHADAHAPEHSERAYCVECDVTFASRARYRRHLSQTKRHAPGLERRVSVPCPECGKMFSRKAYMKNHVRLFHSNDSKHHCPICDKCFVTGFALRTHNKYVHEKKPVPKTKMCAVCGRGFGSNRVLENHVRTHTGERPFACARCPAAFAQRVALRAHLAAVHKQK